MSDTDTTAAPSPEKITGVETLSIHDLKALSLEESEPYVPTDKKPTKKATAKENAATKDAEDEEERFLARAGSPKREELNEKEEAEEEEEDDNTEKKAKPAPKEDSSDDDEEDKEGEAKESKPETEGEEEETTGKYAVGKAGEKTYKVPKEAEFEIKINGKLEKVPFQEMINKASAGIQYDRELSNLGREKKTVAQEKEQFYKVRDKTNANLQMIYELSQGPGGIEDLVTYYGMLSGENPDNVMRKLMENTAKEIQRFSQMTEQEIQLYNENRRFKFQQKIQETANAKAEEQQRFLKERSEVEAELGKIGATREEFLAALEEVKEKLDSGELEGEWTPLDVVDYLDDKKYEAKIVEAISSESESLAKDNSFARKVIKVVKATEESVGERFTRKELRRLIRNLAGIDNETLSESLSRKADREKKSGKTNSQSVISQRRDDDDAITLSDHRSRFYR